MRSDCIITHLISSLLQLDMPISYPFYPQILSTSETCFDDFIHCVAIQVNGCNVTVHKAIINLYADYSDLFDKSNVIADFGNLEFGL